MQAVMNEEMDLVAAFLNQAAVEFDGPPSAYDYKGWQPYIIPLIPDSLYVGDDSVGLLNAANRLPATFPIAAGANRDFILTTPDDRPFLMLDCKFAVDLGLEQSRFALTDTGANLPLGLLGILNTIRPVWTNMAASIVVSNTGKNIYGGMAMTSAITLDPVTPYDTTTGPKEVRIPITNLQGIADGKGCLRTPYLISPSATIRVSVWNRNSTTRYVNGAIFGYKMLARA